LPLTGWGVSVPDDWELLEKIFTGTDQFGELQNSFNLLLSPTEAELRLAELLGEIGYDPAQIARIQTIAASPETSETLRHHKDLVEKTIRTIKIPTILFGGRRFDRVIEEEQLK